MRNRLMLKGQLYQSNHKKTHTIIIQNYLEKDENTPVDVLRIQGLTLKQPAGVRISTLKQWNLDCTVPLKFST